MVAMFIICQGVINSKEWLITSKEGEPPLFHSVSLTLCVNKMQPGERHKQPTKNVKEGYVQR